MNKKTIDGKSKLVPIRNTKMIPDRSESLMEIPIFVSSSFEDNDKNNILVSEEEQLVINDYYNEPWIQTFSGKRFAPLNPQAASIDIKDIAHALSMQCRFNGHVLDFYSVAQHSVFVSYLCNKENRLYGLLHDSAEAYMCDLSSPLKRSGKFDNFKEVEKNIMKTICKVFHLSENEPHDVKEADLMMLYTEERELFNIHRADWTKGPDVPFKIKPFLPQEAESLFLKRFYELSTDHNI